MNPNCKDCGRSFPADPISEDDIPVIGKNDRWCSKCWEKKFVATGIQGVYTYRNPGDPQVD